MKLKLILSAALVAGVISTQAATEMPALGTPSLSTNSAAMGGASSADAMTTLFGDPVLAKAKGFEIKRSTLDQYASNARTQAASSGQQLPENFDAIVLNELVTVQMLLQKATPADKAAGKLESDQQFTNMMAHLPSPDALDRELKLAGMTVGQLRQNATDEATAKIALKRELHVAVSPEEVREAYTNHEANFEEPERVHVEHILLLTIDPSTKLPLSTNTIAEKRQTINDLLKRVKNGEDFHALAKQYSEDPGSKANGGELPKFGRGDMVPEFESAAFALKPGEISDVVTTMYGFHVIKMLDRSPAKKFGFSEPIPEANNDTPEIICTRGLEAQKIKQQAPAFITQLRKEMGVEILDPTLKAATDAMLANTNNAAGANN